MQKSILKNIIIATLPVFAYIIADSILQDTVISLIIAISISIIEFIISFLRFKKIDFFIFFDLSLILTMGMISIILNNPIFFKLKPAIIEMILILFFIPLCMSSNFLNGYINRYLKNITIPDNKIKIMQKNIVFLIPLFLIHVILIVISAFYFSKEVWGFVSGILLYIIFGLIFGIILLYKFFANKIYLYKFKNEEWFDIVDDEGKVTGKAPRSICHNGSKLLHPVVHVHIINSDSKLLLQKRSMNKDIQPGKWDTSVGGHISSGEKLEGALLREVKEEVGIDINFKNIIPLAKYIFESQIEKELVFSFIYHTDEKIKFNTTEIDEVKFFSINEIENLVKENNVTENFIKELSYLKIIIKKGLIKLNGNSKN